MKSLKQKIYIVNIGHCDSDAREYYALVATSKSAAWDAMQDSDIAGVDILVHTPQQFDRAFSGIAVLQTI